VVNAQKAGLWKMCKGLKVKYNNKGGEMGLDRCG